MTTGEEERKEERKEDEEEEGPDSLDHITCPTHELWFWTGRRLVRVNGTAADRGKGARATRGARGGPSPAPLGSHEDPTQPTFALWFVLSPPGVGGSYRSGQGFNTEGAAKFLSKTARQSKQHKRKFNQRDLTNLPDLP